MWSDDDKKKKKGKKGKKNQPAVEEQTEDAGEGDTGKVSSKNTGNPYFHKFPEIFEIFPMTLYYTKDSK